MKKSIIGLVIGLIVGLTLSANASQLIGKSIDSIYPLFIDGTRCTVDAISIDGTSYMPLRKASEMFGYDIDFSSDVVLLNKQKTTQQQISKTIDNSISLPKSETITFNEFNRLEIGMSYEEVKNIIGGPGKVSSEHKSDWAHVITYTWYGTEGNYTSAWLTFIDGKLKSKGQFGLE